MAIPPPLPPVTARTQGFSGRARIPIVAGVGIVVLVAIGIFAASGMVAINRAKSASTLATATSLEYSINQFYLNYGILPNPGSAKLSHDIVFDTAGLEGQALLSILMAKEPGPPLQNSKKIVLFVGRPGTRGKNGVITLPSGFSELRDPWGNPYQVIIDGDYDETMTPPADSSSTAPVRGRRVLVYSLGRDGKGGAEAVRTW